MAGNKSTQVSLVDRLKSHATKNPNLWDPNNMIPYEVGSDGNYPFEIVVDGRQTEEQKARLVNKKAAERGAAYMHKGLEDAAKVVRPIVTTAAGLSMGSAIGEGLSQLWNMIRPGTKIGQHIGEFANGVLKYESVNQPYRYITGGEDIASDVSKQMLSSVTSNPEAQFAGAMLISAALPGIDAKYIPRFFTENPAYLIPVKNALNKGVAKDRVLWYLKNYDLNKRGRLSKADSNQFARYEDEILHPSKEAAVVSRQAALDAKGVIKSGVEDFPDWNAKEWFNGKDSPRRSIPTPQDIADFNNHVKTEYLDLTKQLIKSGDLVKKGNMWYGKIDGEYYQFQQPQEYVVSRSKNFEANWQDIDPRYRSGVQHSRVSQLEKDNTAATYLNNNPPVYGHYAAWTPQGEKGNGVIIRYAAQKGTFDNIPIIHAPQGATSNNFHGDRPIQQVFNEEVEGPAAIFSNYKDIGSGTHVDKTLILRSNVKVKSIRGNNGNFDPNKGLFSYNSNNKNTDNRFLT